MTSNESSTRRSFRRTGSTNDRRVVSTADGAVSRSGELHISASGDSEQQSVVDGPATSSVIVAVRDVASVVDVIPDGDRISRRALAARQLATLERISSKISSALQSSTREFLNESQADVHQVRYKIKPVSTSFAALHCGDWH